MRELLIIGHASVGEKSLIKVLQEIPKSDLDCLLKKISVSTDMLKKQNELNEEMINSITEFNTLNIDNNIKRNKKNKSLKNWQKDKFWE